MPIATLRPAATVVVLREAARGDGFEVLMVRRNDQVAFMAGSYVFPGGRVDDDDRGQAPGQQGGPSRFPELTSEEEHAYRVAAVRELQEEAAVRVEVGDLEPLAHWVTPEIEIRRYDTRFFLVRMPAGQEARHDEGETTELAWMQPAEAIGRAQRKEIMLPPPTWTTLKRLGRFHSINEVFEWARSTPIVRVQPQFLRDDERTMLTLPGDPSYPTVEGWEVPEDTRFLLQKGRWLPVQV